MIGNESKIISLKDGEELRIGRDKNCDIVISDPTFSRRHAKVYREGNSLYIADFESTYGTRINGIKIPSHQKVMLGETDEVRVAEKLFFIIEKNIHGFLHLVIQDDLFELLSTLDEEVNQDLELLLEVNNNGKEKTVKVGRMNYQAFFPYQRPIGVNRNKISREHFELKRDKVGLWIRDLNSTNGTKLNNNLLGSEFTHISLRDKIKVANEFTLVVIRLNPEEDLESLFAQQNDPTSLDLNS